jgi:hypothetical protein
VTSSPNSPMDKIPTDSLEAELPPEAFRKVDSQNQRREDDLLPHSGVQLWVHRLLVLLLVFVCAAMGVLLLILPWRPEWTDNHLLLGSPGLRTFVSNGFVRGLCSGLGLLDIWIGFWEAVHYHETNRH